MDNNSVHLLIDNREIKLIDSIKTVFNGPYTYKTTVGSLSCSTKQLDVGDYVIVTINSDKVPEKPLAVIERKTLKDFNSSLKDGRCDNKEKLLRFREETGCKIYYLIEGPIDPTTETKYAGIKYAATLASIYKLQIEDNIAIIRTRNKDHTSRELHLLSEIYLRLLSDPTSSIGGAELANRGGFEESVKKAKLSPEEEFNRSLVKAWSTLHGISVSIGAKLSADYTLMAWVKGEITCPEFIFNGRKNNKVVGYLNTKPSKEQIIKIISCVRGLSKKSVEEIFAVIDIDYFFAPYKSFKYGEKNTTFTLKKYESVVAFLNAKTS